MMPNTTSLDKYAGKQEAEVARRLVRRALEAGYSISVDDGGETTVTKSKDRKEIIEAMCTTGQDWLRFHLGDQKLGTMMLVYQNGPGDELIADYSDNPEMEMLYRLANNEV